jgi:hypothetical protein
MVERLAENRLNQEVDERPAEPVVMGESVEIILAIVAPLLVGTEETIHGASKSLAIGSTATSTDGRTRCR